MLKLVVLNIMLLHMSKAMIIILILLLCCGLLSGSAFLIGNFEINGKCLYRGPYATNSGNLCDIYTTPNEVEENSEASNNDSTLNSYDGKQVINFTFDYPNEFFVDESNSDIIIVYAQNQEDNLNIKYKDKPISVNKTNCETDGEVFVESLSSYDAQIIDATVEKVGELDACRVEFTADYGVGNGFVQQIQYTIDANVGRYEITISINEDNSNLAPLEEIVESFRLND
jgi:hypothetical protein